MLDRRTFLSASLGTAAALSAAPVRPAGARQENRAAAPRTTEVAVIGAGLFGSAAARYLAGQAMDVTLVGPAEPVDRRTHAGVFASHFDASRLVRGIDPDALWATLARRSIARYRDLEAASGVDFYRDVGYMMVTPGGLGEDWFDLPAMRKVAADQGVPILDLSDRDLAERFPYLAFTPGSSAVLQAEDAGYIDPRGLLAAQQALARAQGAELLRDEAVSLAVKGGQVEVGLRSGGKLRANRALVATGAYTNAVALLPRQLRFLLRAAMIMETEVPPDTEAGYPTTLYAKTDGAEDFWGLLMPPIRYADGRTVIKTMDGYYGPAPLAGMEALNAWMRGDGHEDHHAVLQRALREVFPSLAVLSTRFKPCLIADTPSHYPYIDLVDERIGVVTGGNGKSAKSSDEIGRLAAALLGGGDWPEDLPQAPFAARFT